MEVEPGIFDIRFQHPQTHYVSGPSTSGKTHKILDLIRKKDDVFVGGDKIQNIILCYDSWQDAYDTFKRDCKVNHFLNKMPTEEEFINLTKPYKNKGGSIVVIDDMLSNLDANLDKIFRVTARHNNVSAFVLFQSLFPPYKYARQLSLNSKYFHLFKNPRESGQIVHFARQSKPENIPYVRDIFLNATNEPYGCLLMDFTQECKGIVRYRTRYFSNKGHTVTYEEL